jgi:hypothetical protein
MAGKAWADAVSGAAQTVPPPSKASGEPQTATVPQFFLSFEISQSLLHRHRRGIHPAQAGLRIFLQNFGSRIVMAG